MVIFCHIKQLVSHSFFFYNTLQVDILQMCILEFKNRPGNPLFHLEHFIDGNYIKYNSNSGFVEETLRFTPQVRLQSLFFFKIIESVLIQNMLESLK